MVGPAPLRQVQVQPSKPVKVIRKQETTEQRELVCKGVSGAGAGCLPQHKKPAAPHDPLHPFDTPHPAGP